MTRKKNPGIPLFSLWSSDEEPKVIKKKRTLETSYLKIDNSRYVKHKRDAIRYMIDFINNNYAGMVKTAYDGMAGKGIFTEYLLQIDGLEDLRLNDKAEDCYMYLLQKFHNHPKITRITNTDFFHVVLGVLGRRADLVVVDFNNFTLNRKDQVDAFLEWIHYNRQWLNLLLYTDSFYFSLKFLKDESERQTKYQEYLKRVEEALKMKIVADYPYKNKGCSLILLQNGEWI